MASPSKLVRGRFLAISHKFRTRNQKNEPPVKMYDSTFKHTILLYPSFRTQKKKAVLSTTLWRVVGVVPGGAQKSSGGWREGSNPPQGVPGDHSWLSLEAV